jgi:hypothetical protein
MNSKYNIISFKCFTLDQVKIINKQIQKNVVGEEPESSVAQPINGMKTGTFTHVHCASLMELIHPWLYNIQLINKDIFGYDVYWHFHLDTLQYNVYGVGGKYGWHIDAGIESHTGPVIASDIKLTCLLNLSEEPYEGGEFHTINDSGEIHEFTPGMGLIMNSLIAHQVTPVTKGERITLTYWATGPAWK